MKKAAIVLGVLVVAGLVLALAMRRPAVPAYAALPSLEHKYSGQIGRLSALAQAPQRYQTLDPSQIEADAALFAPPEILEARVETDPKHIRTLGDKSFNWQTQTDSSVRRPSAGQPVVNRHWYKLQDGTPVNAVEYRTVVTGPRGEVGIMILFDLDKLPRT